MIDLRPVAVDPDAGKARPVGIKVAVRIPPEAAGHPHPRLADDQLPHRSPDQVARIVHHVGVHAGHRPTEGAGLLRLDRHAADDAAAGLGAAGIVDDRAAPAADLVEVPAPGTWVPGFSGGAKNPQGAEVTLSWPVRTVRHQGADSRRGDPKHGDAVSLDQMPEPVRLGVVGGSLEQEQRRAEHESAADRPRTHHPAQVGQPEQDIVPLQIEAVGEIVGSLDREASVDMDRPLRATGGARGVDDHVRVVGSRRLRRILSRDALDNFVPPDVPPLAPGHHVPGAPQHQAALHLRCQFEGHVRRRLERDGSAPAEEAVGGDEQLRLAVAQAGSYRVRPVAREHRHIDGADLAAGKDSHHGLWKHWKKDPDAVPLANPERAERVGEAVRLDSQLPVGQLPNLSIVTLPGDGELIAARPGCVAVERVVDVIEAAASKPVRPGRTSGEVQHLLVGPDPGEVQVAYDGVPVPGGVGRRAAKQVLVVGRANSGHESSKSASL